MAKCRHRRKVDWRKFGRAVQFVLNLALLAERVFRHL
jgi:hypothetical protein